MPRKESYPWDVWFDGQVYQLQRGIDFHLSCKDFRSTIYQVLSRKGLTGKFRISIEDENTIIIFPSNQLALSDKEDKAKNSVVDPLEVERGVGFERQYPRIASTFAELKRGGYEKQITVRRPIKDSDGNFIREIDRKDVNGKDVYIPGQIGKDILMEEEVVETIFCEADKSVELYYPNDIPITPKAAAGKIRMFAMSYFAGTDIDPTKWYYSWDNKKLSITFGEEGVELYEKEKVIEVEKIKLHEENLQDILPVTREKLSEWLGLLKDKLHLQLRRGKDYSCSDIKLISLFYSYAEQFGVNLPEWGLTAEKGLITLSLRTPEPEAALRRNMQRDEMGQLLQTDIKSKQRAKDRIEKHRVGKKIPQPEDIQKEHEQLKIEEEKHSESESDLQAQINKCSEDLHKAITTNKSEMAIKYFRDKLANLQHEHDSKR